MLLHQCMVNTVCLNDKAQHVLMERGNDQPNMKVYNNSTLNISPLECCLKEVYYCIIFITYTGLGIGHNYF